MTFAIQTFPAYAIAVLSGIVFAAPGLQAQNLQDDAALVARGEYLARAADCAPCHTGKGSEPFRREFVPCNTLRYTVLR